MKCIVFVRRLIITISVVALALIWVTNVLAQKERQQPILSFNQIMPGSIMWSNDSHEFLLLNIINPDKPEWLEYNLNKNILQQSQKWPLQPELTADEIETFRPFIPEQGVETPIFTSPDERYLVYITDVVDPGRDIVNIALTNRKERTTVFFSDSVGSIQNILWSDDGKSFAINSGIFPEQRRVWYVGKYTEDVTKAVLQEPYIQPQGESSFTERGAYDISRDGDYLLLRVSENVPQKPESNTLCIYDVTNQAINRCLEAIDASQVVAAAFAPNDENKIWLFNDMGVVQYDLSTKEITVIDTEFNSSKTYPGFNAMFSPDGQHLAVLQEDSGLYIVDLTKEAEES